MKNVIYRNIVVFGGFAIILDVIFFNRIESLSNVSLFVDFIITPIFMIFSTLWIKNKIAILSLTLFVIGFSIEVLSQFYILKNMGVFKLYAIGIIVSFLMMCFAVFNKSEKGWWLKKSQKIELHTIITILVAHSVTLISFIFLN